VQHTHIHTNEKLETSYSDERTNEVGLSNRKMKRRGGRNIFWSLSISLLFNISLKASSLSLISLFACVFFCGSTFWMGSCLADLQQQQQHRNQENLLFSLHLFHTHTSLQYLLYPGKNEATRSHTHTHSQHASYTKCVSCVSLALHLESVHFEHSLLLLRTLGSLTCLLTSLSSLFARVLQF